MRRLLTFAAASAALAATGAQAQTPGRVLSWPGKTAPAPGVMATGPAPAPFIAYSNGAPVAAPRVENRYSPRTSAPRQMARMTVPTPVYSPPPAYVPPPVSAAPQP
ncbi:MAG: hypothetical protein M3M95_08215, partial [Pseudomonadota bacterium]|nr:hypothetical protein [Pseudomonadota bacterium]